MGKSQSNSAVWFDYNNDGFKDLFIANGGDNSFYVNDGNGKFSDETDSAGLLENNGGNSVATCTGDFNNDGFIDLYITNVSATGNILFRNNGNGTFTDITLTSATADVGDGRTCAFVDHDGDGLLDIFSTNHTSASKMHHNQGNEKFINIALELALSLPVDVYSATWADYNKDGFIDVFLNGHLGKGLFENPGSNNNNVVIELIGDGTNTNISAIGTRVDMTSENLKQTREVSGGRGCCEQDMLPLHFGTSKDDIVSIVVNWTDGSKCSFKDINVKGNKTIKIKHKMCSIEISP